MQLRDSDVPFRPNNFFDTNFGFEMVEGGAKMGIIGYALFCPSFYIYYYYYI